MKPRIYEFELDIPAIVKDYARNYVLHSNVHESLDEFGNRVANDLKMPKAKQWAITEVKRLERDFVTA